MKKFIESYLTKANSIVLLSHKNPDGDAISSLLAMHHFLSGKGYHTKMFCPDSFPDFLNWMNGSEHILNYEMHKEQAIEAVFNADVIFCLDLNHPDRLGELGPLLINSKAKLALIDHHPNPDDFVDAVYSDTKVSSAAELVYHWIREFYDEQPDLVTAECILTGIMSDTGGFAFNSSQVKTYQVVSELLRKGVDKDKIYSNLFNNYGYKRMQLMGFALSQRMKLIPELNTAYIWLSRADLDLFDHQKGDTEGFVNLPLSIQGVVFSALFIEKEDHTKISFRSKGSFKVNEFSHAHFNGGGHNNAAGGNFQGRLEDALDFFIKTSRKYHKELNYVIK